ncbi:MAG: class I SAM-dependent methyltransferase [Bdellovibrionales bacterium]|nr:class I SAM-dependent methyltransferase [Bdellovibrionales bacterium]
MGQDAYIDYIQSFFRRWAPLYDLFAAPIAYVYSAAVRFASFPEGTRVLDICTGTGQIAKRLAQRGTSVVGVDISEAMLAHAVQRGSHGLFEVARMDVRQLAFPNRSFEYAIISLALHDMPRKVRLAVLAEAARVSRKVLVLDYELPLTNPWRAIAWHTIRLFESPYFRQFAREDPRELFREANFEVVRERKLFAHWFTVFELSPRF